MTDASCMYQGMCTLGLGRRFSQSHQARDACVPRCFLVWGSQWRGPVRSGRGWELETRVRDWLRGTRSSPSWLACDWGGHTSRERGAKEREVEVDARGG